jgi:hypothetical protein
VYPDYQSKAVLTQIIFEYHTTFIEKGIENCGLTPDNHAIHAIWKIP